jgi:diketogulonate reductase-like aldo/keto reductase
MQNQPDRPTRRDFFRLLTGLAGTCLLPGLAGAASQAALTKAIPKSGEALPVIGMGTSRTFDATGDPASLSRLAEVLSTFFAHGGSLIDSSPMYGAAERVLGTLLRDIAPRPALFAATKVWTDGKAAGERQMERSRELWGVEGFDLMQIHNLRDWEVHLETLLAMKDAGRVRYIGITTSHGRDHEELEAVLDRHPFDFVQFSYNIVDRQVEQRLLPLAEERGIAVLVNRPFARGSLFREVRGKALPDWAAEFDCASWGQFFLKYVVSHPGVTCAIPATSKVHHMVDNMGAGFGRLPDAAMRDRMATHIRAL